MDILIYFLGMLMASIITGVWCKYVPNTLLKSIIDGNKDQYLPEVIAVVIAFHLLWPFTLTAIAISAVCRMWVKLAGIGSNDD